MTAGRSAHTSSRCGSQFATGRSVFPDHVRTPRQVGAKGVYCSRPYREYVRRRSGPVRRRQLPDLNPVLEDLSYPITADEFVEEYGDREPPRTNADPIEVGTVLEYMGGTTFESEEELRQQIAGYTKCRFPVHAQRYVVRENEVLHADLGSLNPIEKQP